MKRRFLAAVTAAALLLSGCSSLLNRDYVHVTPHNSNLTAEGDPSVLRVESYQELVNALIYFISQGIETGSIRLYSDSRDAEADLEAACLEVVQEDPLGAYAVDYIKYNVTSIVTYDEADVQITYRRSREQIASIASATGTTAIRSELEETMAAFAPECVLRISYFDEDYEYIQALIRQAYFAAPETALDYPRASVTFYPDSGRQRIVEILLTYQLDQEELQRRKSALALLADDMAGRLWDAMDDQGLLDIRAAILGSARYVPGGGSTAYHTLAEHQADSLGLALAMSLLCQRLNYSCQIVEGSLNGEPHSWNLVSTQAGWRHMDLARPAGEEDVFLWDAQMEQLGYDWDREAVPPCEAPEESDAPSPEL
ncbi:hypothetical protein [Pseudoflavonifractor phocaeensis]|uniref:hypothetical protein n=1 Tax=Pseudoflavonifractor phocaeensis TaxID=1870988 RepID=UPI001F2B6907|nr:hypothetical protein [Pseudoflavonifractor phocaeensis]MCF2595061.1 hypothetical protein [Pseudoflavonifractor phocaeensis]